MLEAKVCVEARDFHIKGLYRIVLEMQHKLSHMEKLPQENPDADIHVIEKDTKDEPSEFSLE